MPRIVHVAQLWSLVGHPSGTAEWSLDRKMRAVKEAEFQGVGADVTTEHRRLAEKHGIEHVLGYISSSDPAEFEAKLRRQKEGGAIQINVQMDNHDTPPKLAAAHWVRMMRLAEKVGGVVPSLEVHRDTCTESPEKTLEIAERYEKATGEPIRLNFDFSHFAVVKHLAPANYAERLLTWSDLIALSEQCHMRPFNGHHCQVPVTHRGHLTPEVRSYLDFVEDLMRVWVSAPRNRDRTWFVSPEMGPYGPGGGGYNITGLPPAWPDAVELRRQLARVWGKVVKSRRPRR